ncbi:MAG: methyltransferase domain-containing protein [Thermoplasmata archaeon]
MRDVVLLNERGKKWRVPVGEGLRNVRDVGRVNTDGLDRLVGRGIEVKGRTYAVLEPSVRDRIETIHRKAQIVGPKDAAYLVFHTDLQAGDTVVEGGAGSGALTIALAHTVAPSGRVVSYDVRPDFREVASTNVREAGYADVVDFRAADIAQGIEEAGVKAVVLDLPEPWAVVPAAKAALRPTGHFASYSPTMEQMRDTVRVLRDEGFVDVWSVELLERRMEVGRGTRPAFRMLGHTGYTTFARQMEDAG